MGNRYKIGLIRVISVENTELLNLHGKMIEKNYSDLKVVSKCIPNQPYGVHNDETEKLAIPKIIELAKNWEGLDALIISCAGDPGVKELRDILDIPVIGAGESAAILARRYGRIFGVLGITEDVPFVYKKFLGSDIVGTPDVQDVESTLDLMNDHGRKMVIEKALRLKSLGAEVIALACTGMATIGIAKELEQTCRIPVIDPVIAEGLITMYECVRNN